MEEADAKEADAEEADPDFNLGNLALDEPRNVDIVGGESPNSPVIESPSDNDGEVQD